MSINEPLSSAFARAFVHPLTRREVLAAAGLGAGTLGVVGLGGCAAAGDGGETGAGDATGAAAARGVEKIEPLGDTSGWDTAYYQAKYATFDEVRAASEEVARQIEAEGIVLLRNTGGVLPLAAGQAVSLVGRGAVDVVYGGSGAALIDKIHAVDAREAFSAHFSVNDVAFDWLASVAPDYPRATVGALDKPETVSYYLGEIPWSAYPDEARDSLDGTVGVVVISRPSGEGADLSQDLLTTLESGVSPVFTPNDETANYAPGQHQLELCQEELELLAQVKKRCSALMVLLNVATTMEVGPLLEAGGACEADAIVQIGFPGTKGLLAVADVLAGVVNPSGRTCDLWAADLSATPSFNNFGNHTYTDVTDYYTSIGSGAHFVEYAEGIYVGYRYYETAAAEAEAGNYAGFSYDAAVSFPFGHGLSYTTFDQRLIDVSVNEDQVKVVASVTNTGKLAGKEVVQVYATPPASSSIEKSVAALVAFSKTAELAPGESAQVELSFAVRDLASWDGAHGCWRLDAGTYRISLRSDSHTAIDARDLAFDACDYACDSATGAPVKNRFDDVTAYMEAYCTQLTRRDFAGTFPKPACDKTAASVGLELTEYDAAAHVNPADEMPAEREKNGLSLIDLRGRAMGDPAWELLLNQLVPNVMAIILNNHSYGSDSVPSIGKPKTLEGDGPAGISVYVDDQGHCGFPSEYTVAQTWNAELARAEGEAIGQEMLLCGMSGWCAPAMNCHRSPFGGRNFEYYSEDPLLAGTLGAAAIEGAFTCGVYSQMKHFCLNDQDTNRCAHLLTWASEQAIREIYARPFEIAVKTARGRVPYLDDATGERREREVSAAKAVMSSYNYIGSTWAGGCEALCTGLLRDEWGYDGHVVSDWTLYDYTDKNQAFYAGTDVNFTTTAQTGEMSDSTSATAVLAMRQAMHRYLYSVVNSNAVNGLAPTARITYREG